MNKYDTEEVYRLAADRWPDVSLEQTRLVVNRKPRTEREWEEARRAALEPVPEGMTHTVIHAERLGPYWLGYSAELDRLVLWVGYDEYDMRGRPPE